jgi:hypothetical protein
MPVVPRGMNDREHGSEIITQPVEDAVRKAWR